MPFVTLPFFIFVFAVATVYFLTPSKYRWGVLLIASYVYFYLCSGWLLAIHFAATLITFVTGISLDKIYIAGEGEVKRIAEENKDLDKAELKTLKKAAKKQTERKAKGVLAIGIIIVLGILVAMKYFNVLGGMTGLLLPIGISFYTLQAIGYMVDVYRQNQEADNNIFKFALFMSFFPQIVQGPFARYGHLAGQLYEGHDFDYDRVMKGAQLILWGLMKKLILADRLAAAVSAVYDNYSDYHGPMIFFGAAIFFLQMYGDFSGGIDIARGVAQILGINLTPNFRQPYFATTVDTFWRRWHISLGAWMRDYIFYSLTLSKPFANLGRKSAKVLGPNISKKIPAVLAMLIVFFLVGIWHGPEGKYVAYGLWNGIFISTTILLEDVYSKLRGLLGIDGESSGWKVFSMIRTFVIITLGSIFDGAADLKDAFSMFKNLGTKWWDISCFLDGSLKGLGLDTANWMVIFISVLIIFAVDFAHEKGVEIREKIGKQNIILRWVVFYAAILALIILGMWGPSYDSAGFMYEQF